MDRLELGRVVDVRGVQTYIHPDDMERYVGGTLICSYDGRTYPIKANQIIFDGVHGDRILVQQNGEKPQIVFFSQIKGIIPIDPEPEDLLSSDDWLNL